MIGRSRTEVLESMGDDLSRGLLGIYFRIVLGDDDGAVLTAADQVAVLDAMQAEIDRLAARVAAQAGSAAELEAAQ